jgi:ferredoxin
MQFPLVVVSGFMLFDGFLGPQLSPKNLATVITWLHYPGLVVFGLLVGGNLFCMACPFMLPRQAGRWLGQHILGRGRSVPRFLRNKWLSILLLFAFFYATDRFTLWDSPLLTAWLILGYFLVAFLVDAWFQGAAFCKYVCPLGQLHFFGSLCSPLEIKVRDADGCAGCHTKNCIAGGRGCELWLFQPRKAGNMDCTFCLDCVHACPYDNIALAARQPTQEIWTDPYRSGVRRFSQRPDLMALVVLLTFASFITAFEMIKPVYDMRDYLASAHGMDPGLTLVVTYVIGLAALPALSVLLAGWASGRLAQPAEPIGKAVARYVYSLVPVGFGMWVAHYAFHFLTGALTIVPVVQSFMADVGLYGGTVQWGLGPVVPLTWLFPIEAVFIYLGAMGSLIVAFQMAERRRTENTKQGLEDGGAGNTPGGTAPFLYPALPWMLLVLLLLAAGLWILIQPMYMIGTFGGFSPPGG